MKKVVLWVLAVAVVAVGAFYFSKLNLAKKDNYTRFEFFNVDGRNPASQKGQKKSRPGGVLYKLREDATTAETQALNKVLEKFDVRVQKKISNEKVHVAKAEKLDGASETDVAEEIKASGAVAFAEADAIVDFNFVPNDPISNQQWHHQKIASYEAWDITRGQSQVIVANCDTGVESSHPDLRDRLVLPGYNSADGSTNSEPVHNHGTMTAGTTAATVNNAIGVAGVGGDIRILPIRITNESNGGAAYSWMAGCIEYAAIHGAKVVNLSYGGAESYTVDEAAQYLRARGGILVMSAGNAGIDASQNPDFASFIIVGATDQIDARPYWSNYGLPTDLVAPGVDVLTTNQGNSYAYGSGTSFSAPIVSGVAALVFSINPNFSPLQVEDILFSTATRLGTGANDLEFGNGRVHALAAVQRAQQLNAGPTPSPTPRPTATPRPSPTPSPTPKPKGKPRR